MGTIDTDKLQIHGLAATAAATVATDFAIYQQSLRGVDIASAATVTPGIEDYFHVTGTIGVNFIGTANLLPGRKFLLYFPSSLVLGHNVASPPGGTVPMLLLAGANTTTGAGGKAWFVYDDGVGAAIQVAGVGPAAAVASVSAGPGITITGTSTNPIVNNAGVISVSAGPGISITGTGANPIVNNTGVLSVVAGTNINITGTAQNPVVNVTGVVTTVLPGLGISVTGTSTAPIVNNTGVLSILPGTGITVSGGGSNPTVTAKIVGSITLGGQFLMSGSSRLWFKPGKFDPDLSPWELPIDDFIAAGATTMTISGFVFSYVSSGGATPTALTLKGAAIAGATYNINFGGVGFGGTMAIPADPGTPGPMRIGLSMVGNGTSTTMVIAITITFK